MMWWGESNIGIGMSCPEHLPALLGVQLVILKIQPHDFGKVVKRNGYAFTGLIQLQRREVVQLLLVLTWTPVWDV